MTMDRQKNPWVMMAAADDDDVETPGTLTVQDMLKLSPDERDRIVRREFEAGR